MVGGEAWDYTVSRKKTPGAVRLHSFDLVEAQAVRIDIQAANRGAQARVFEVRCHA